MFFLNFESVRPPSHSTCSSILLYSIHFFFSKEGYSSYNSWSCWNVCICVYVCVGMRACVRAYVCARAYLCVRARVCVGVCVYPCMCGRACMCGIFFAPRSVFRNLTKHLQLTLLGGSHSVGRGWGWVGGGGDTPS